MSHQPPEHDQEMPLVAHLSELRDRCHGPQEAEDCGILRQLNVSGGVQLLPDDGHTHVGKSHSH